jgi:hypothetical protein
MSSKRDLGLALGCLEYDMHVLAMALLIQRKGGAQWQPFPTAFSEMVASALLTKARSLVEFLMHKPEPGRITVETFGVERRKGGTLGAFLGYVSQHSVHLDWKRARAEVSRRPAKYEEALGVLRECAAVCSQIRERGVTLSAERHRKRHAVLRAQLTALGIELL